MSRLNGKSANYMDRRIPENPRYKHVKPVVDSGASMTKYYEKLEEIRKNYKFKKDEIFRRIKASTFIQLVLQIASVGIEDGQLLEECPIHSRAETTPPSLEPPRSPPQTARSTLSNVITGLGELDITNPDSSPFTTPHQSPSNQLPLSPYLLLDVRSVELFDKCHIITANNYPAKMLSRSVNPYTKELYEYRNKPEHIIILYDEDETIAPEVCTNLVQRGFDNVFMLSGGLKVLNKYFPQGIITGMIPLSCRPSPPPGTGRKRSVQPLPSQLTEVRDYFTMDDLMNLQQKLDEVLLIPSYSVSRMSSTQSTISANGTRPQTNGTRPHTIWKY